MTKEFFGANLKMNPSSKEDMASLLQGYVDNDVCGNDKREIVIFLPDIYLGYLIGRHKSLVSSLGAKNICLGTQDISEFTIGAHTGETSPAVVKDLGASYVLIGHSEVRERLESLGASKEKINMYFNRKIKKALEIGLNVLYCVGELESERESGTTDEVIRSQLQRGLEGISNENLRNMVVVAYEPRWAIGAGKKPPLIREIETVVKDVLEINPFSRITYGGNMNPDNTSDIMKIPGVSGGLIGGASLNAKSFVGIVKYRT